jgi:hypothetical protein
MEQIKHERNKRYGWLLLFALINWLLIGLVIYFVNPENIRNILIPGSYLPLSLIVALGFFWIFTIILMSTKRAVRWTLGTMIFIFLRLGGLGSLLNGVLIFGLLGSLELYLIRTKPPDRETVA